MSFYIPWYSSRYNGIPIRMTPNRLNFYVFEKDDTRKRSCLTKTARIVYILKYVWNPKVKSKKFSGNTLIVSDLSK